MVQCVRVLLFGVSCSYTLVLQMGNRNGTKTQATTDPTSSEPRHKQKRPDHKTTERNVFLTQYKSRVQISKYTNFQIDKSEHCNTQNRPTKTKTKRKQANKTVSTHHTDPCFIRRQRGDDLTGRAQTERCGHLLLANGIIGSPFRVCLLAIERITRTVYAQQS